MINTYWLEFSRAICIKLGLKPTANRIQFLYAWMAGENTKAKNNPLATTWDMSRVDPGQQNFNYNGGYPVKSYSTPAIGLQATINTLKGGYYPEILRFLNSNISLANASGVLIQNLRTWGTGSLPVQIFNSWDQNFKKLLNPTAGSALLLTVVVLGFVFRKKIFR